MSSERSLFQQVVAKSASREIRHEAIHELGQLDAVSQLATITRTNGIHGSLRREAVSELRGIGATAALESIAADRTVDTAIRKQARQ
ncbi:hypothetical protein [Halococcus sp. IIIV-5B]|uniref:hypothetical protein n=1 Tax=Halococcus sp. IIIV-5B TaxID=2321230 RepID=UPI000E7209CD|nr:hypothetical protein [Halococcus sp. IIIV-5B]RJT07850.1 hypothetical protein D3261_00350 [Halococcus sp. IIIV-5B]